jgi:hypothetical protein
LDKKPWDRHGLTRVGRPFDRHLCGIRIASELCERM